MKLPQGKSLRGVLAIFAVTLFSFGRSFSNGFVSDDLVTVVNNPYIRDWSLLPRIFLTDCWGSIGMSHGLYRPITLFSFLAEHTLAGLNPLVYHLDNVLLHFLSSVLFYFIVKEIVSQERVAFLAGLLFASHPVHAEAVSWLGGRGELLAAFFSFASVALFLKKKGAPLMFFFSLLALLAKESAAAVPLLLLIYIIIFEPPEAEGRTRQVFKRLYPFGLALAVYLVLRWAAVGLHSVPAQERALQNASPYYSFLVICRAFYEYIRLGLLPFDLSTDYVFPPPPSFFTARTMLPVAVLAALAGLFPLLRKKARVLLFGAVWFFIALLPVSNIIKTSIIMSERAMYIPAAGICLILASGAGMFWKEGEGAGGRAGALSAALMVAFFSFGSAARNEVWKDEDSFLRAHRKAVEHHVGLFPDSPFFYGELAYLDLAQNKTGPETEAEIRKALSLDPEDPDTHKKLAELYRQRGQLADSLKEYEKVLSLRPEAEAYYEGGLICYEFKETRKAQRMFDQAISLSPDKGLYYLTKGYMLIETGNSEAAAEVIKRAEDLDPGLYDAHLQLGIIYGSQKHYKESCEEMKKAVALEPERADGHYYLAVACFGLGNKADATAEVNKALALKPAYEEARRLLSALK